MPKLRCATCGFVAEAPLEGRPAACPVCSSEPDDAVAASLDFDKVPGFIVLDWPQQYEPVVQVANGHAEKLPAPEPAWSGPGQPGRPGPGGSPRDLYRGSLLLVHEQYRTRTGRLKAEAWAALMDLIAEAQLLGLKRRLRHLQLLLESSPTVDGWGQLRLVEALRGEVKPETPPPTGYIGAGSQPATPPTTVVVNHGQAQPEPQKKSLLTRLRGGR